MSKDEYLQEIARRYRQETGKKQINPHDLAEWAYENGHHRWQPDRSSIITRCAKDFARALRNETYVDPQGREVRLNRCVVESPEGQTKMAFWESMKSAAPDFIEKSLQQERMAILARCRKLKTSFDSYRENTNPGTQMELVLDFTDDVVEAELADEVA